MPSERDPEALKSVGAAISRTFEYLNSGTLFWVVVATLIVALVARKWLPDPPLLVIIAAAAIVSILAFTVQLSMASTRDFGRYIAPMSESIVVFLLYEVLRTLDSRQARDRRSTTAGVLVLSAAVVAAVAVFSPLAVLDAPSLAAGWDLLRHPRSPTAAGANLVITPGATERHLDRALKQVDLDPTILAVDRPYLVDYSRFDLPQLDLPGWATPTGAFPFFRGGAAAKIAALRKQGFTNLVATVPANDRCFNPFFMDVRIREGTPPGSVYARYFLDWENAITQIQAEAPGAVTRIGQVLVIDLDRAQDLVGDASR